MSGPPTTTLLLIRHGESQATVNRIIAGEQSCTGLSELGHRQAVALGERLAAGHEPQIDAVWSSTLPRAYETAAVLAAGGGGMAIELDSDLVEHRPGEADGVAFSEYPDRFGSFDIRAEPDRPIAPGAESLNQFHERVTVTLTNIAGAHEGEVAMVVCHGGVIDLALRSFLGLGLGGALDVFTLNCSISEFSREGGEGAWQLRRYNDAAHLAGLPSESARVIR